MNPFEKDWTKLEDGKHCKKCGLSVCVCAREVPTDIASEIFTKLAKKKEAAELLIESSVPACWACGNANTDPHKENCIAYLYDTSPTGKRVLRGGCRAGKTLPLDEPKDSYEVSIVYYRCAKGHTWTDWPHDHICPTCLDCEREWRIANFGQGIERLP